MKKFFDISLPIANDSMVYDGSPKASIEVKTTVKEKGVMLSVISFGSHTGTHIDAPCHFVDGGLSIEQIDLQKCIGLCKVVDVTKIDHLEIMPSDFSSTPIEQGDRILFKTSNSFIDKTKFPDSFVSLSKEAAEVLVKKKVVLAGTDFIGIEKRKNPGHPVHMALLSSNIVVVEGLDLSHVDAGEYTLYCFPIKIIGSDGAPVRAVLIQ